MQSAFGVPTRTYSGLLIPAAQGLSRKEPRAALRRACIVRALSPDNDKAAAEVTGEMINLSRTGMAIQVGAPLPIGTAAQIELHVADDASNALEGRVIRCRRVATGTFEIGIALQPRSAVGSA